MNRFLNALTMVASAACVVVAAGPARGEDLSQTVMLVASSALDGTPLEQTVILAAPSRDGGHLGFIINRPTTTRLDVLFPDESAVRAVAEPVFFGGTAMLPAVFAVTRSSPPDGRVIPLLPGLFAVLDANGVDRLIAAAPNDARYFVGLMTWGTGELERQVGDRIWETQPADAELVLRRQTRGMWNALRGSWV
jgi:putative AlgH/UPF0301 family transcriptional regulator